MPSFDYVRSRATAERLIAKFGQDGAIRRTVNTGPVYDPVQTTTDYACTLVDMDYEDRKIDGTLVLRTDRMIYLSTKGLEIVPSQSDKVLVGGVEHGIINVKPLSPGGVVVFWELQARR